MLTARASRFRDWATFAVVALAPALLVGLLGLRAIRNEEAAANREVARSLEASGERVGHAVERSVADATERVRAMTIAGDDEHVAQAVASVVPPLAEAIVLSPLRTLTWPPPPGPGVGRSTKADRRKCSELLDAFRSRRAAEERQAIRTRILSSCEEAQTDTGRWIWPMVLLDGPGRDRLVGWLETHGALLSEAERDATRAEVQVDAELTDGDRARSLGALDAPGSRRQVLVREIAADGAQLRHSPDASGMVSWRAGTSIGVLRALEDGRLAGFVVHRPTLADAIAAGWLAADATQRIEIVEGQGGPVHGDPRELAASVVVAPGLVLRVVPLDSMAVVRSASRSRLMIAVIAVGATVVAFAVAAGMFARMRAAKRSSELRTDFVSAVSHELRTPIASLRVLAELLEQGKVEEVERAEVHEAIVVEARRLGETVDRLLGFSRMEAGRHAIQRRRERLGEILIECVATFEQRHPELPRVVREIDARIEALVDAAQLRLAIENLLENARKYAPAGAPYVVRLERDAREIRIAIQDRGPGIAPRDQRRVFRAFERIDDRLSRATEGSGIGLSLVRHVARAHGGRVTLDSEVGQGARFTIVLPASEVEEE